MGPFAAAAAAFGGDVLSKGLDLGFGAASSAIQLKMQRKLRRTAYQDTMHSMRKAGLNPILAAGATPMGGTITAPNIGTGTDLSSNAIEAAKAGPEIGEIQSRTGKQSAETESKKAEKRMTELQMENALYERANMVKSWEKMQAEIESIAAGTDLTRTDVNMRAVQALLWKAQTGLANSNASRARAEIPHIGAAIDKIMAEIPGIERAGRGRVAGEVEGMIEGLKDFKGGLDKAGTSMGKSIGQRLDEARGAVRRRRQKYGYED